MYKRKILVSMLMAGGLVAPMAHATNGYLPIGYGMKTEGMGGAGIALPQDAIAAAVNPAGMVMVGDRTDFGLTWFRPNRHADITGNDCSYFAEYDGCTLDGSYDGNGKANFFIPQFGYNRMINADTSLGISVFGNGGMNTQYNTNPLQAISPDPLPRLGINLEQLFIAPTWSMKLNPTNAVGVALNLAYQRFSATGFGPFQPASSNSSSMTDNGTDSSTGYGLRVGWTGEVTPDVTLGATYQTKTKMGKFSKYSGLFEGQGAFDIPSNYGVGIAVKATPATTVAFDVQRINYSDIPSVSNPLASLPVPFGPGPQFGVSGGPGFGWQSINSYKLGVSYVYSPTLTLRGGLDHCDQPIPSSQVMLNIVAPGVVQDHLSLGATWKLENKSELTVAYVHAFKKTVSGALPGTAGGYPMGGGTGSISMYEDSIGISYGW
jgi:long-chain fatty acid transport protein